MNSYKKRKKIYKLTCAASGLEDRLSRPTPPLSRCWAEPSRFPFSSRARVGRPREQPQPHTLSGDADDWTPHIGLVSFSAS
jgi:hypothetical protein